jgi:hypothetical protein
MAAPSLQDRVDSLLTRQVAEDRNYGRQSVDLEVAALIENYATTLLLNPKVVLYLAHLARNGLLKVVRDELLAVETLTKTVSDLGNVTFTIKSTAALTRAQTALLQLENQNIASVGPAYARFERSVTEFLNKQLSKNVRRRGATELTRPEGEAQQDLPTDYSSLQDLHSETLSRLFSMVVGVQNFLSTPLNTVIGAALAYQAREDIQAIIDDVEADASGAQSRDYANRLIASRASLKSVVVPPGIEDPVLSTALPLPHGYLLTASSELLPAVKTFGPGPFASVGTLTVDVDGVAESITPNLGTGPTVIGSQVTWPVVIPPNTHLFFQVGETPVRVVLNSESIEVSKSIGDVIAAIQGAGVGLSAAEYCRSGTGRLVVWAPAATSLAVSESWVAPKHPSAVVINKIPFVYDRSAHAVVGLALGKGLVGATPNMVVDCVTYGLTNAVASASPDGKVVLSSAVPAFGTVMAMSGSLSTAWGINGTVFPTSSVLTLSGTTPTGEVPIPSALLSRGDLLESTVGLSTITPTQSSILLDTPLKTFSGPVTVTSGLLLSWQSLDLGVRAFLSRVQNGPFLKGLGKLDYHISVLAGSATPAQRNQAIDVLDSLVAWLYDLVVTLTGTAKLPDGGAVQERAIAEDLIFTLIERKYDQAADLLSKCQVSEFFDLDYQTMSYGGALLKASSELAQSDLNYPNRSKDEGLKVTSFNAGTGVP